MQIIIQFFLKSVNKENYLDRVSHFDLSFQCMDKLSWSVYHKVLHSATSMRDPAMRIEYVRAHILT